LTIAGPASLIQNAEGSYVATATSPLGVDLSNTVEWSVKRPSTVTYSFLATGATALLLVAEVGAYSLRATVLDPVTGLTGETTASVVSVAAPLPADPIVNVGNDQVVTLDAGSQAQITITFSVVADNPVNLAWSSSGPAPVSFSPLGSTEELAAFSVSGTYLIRLTATDASDNRAEGFDELIVTVNEAPVPAVLVPGELKVDGFAIYTLTKTQGQPISFVWPVTNLGFGSGLAFIRLTEGGALVGAGTSFLINPGQTVNVSFNPVVSLSTGVHVLAAMVMESLPTGNIAVGSPQIITLTVVQVALLEPVGLPTIFGIVGPTSLQVPVRPTIPITWDVRNNGVTTLEARLRTRSDPANISLDQNGQLAPVAGGSTTTLLLTPSSVFMVFGVIYHVTLAMLNSQNVVLSTWGFDIFL
jgi:hypothetical protein